MINKLYAKDARVITELNKYPNPWNRLFNRIREEAEQGKSLLDFDEEREGVRFIENRREVKRMLELLGYTVAYSRVKDNDNYNGIEYHNRYMIRW